MALDQEMTFTRYHLVCLRPGFYGLEDYQFLNEAHARKWLSQPWVTDTEYAICVTQTRRGERQCRHCGHRPEHVLSRRRIAVSAFLAMGEEDGTTEERTP